MTGKEQSLGSLILFFGLPFILGCQENLMGPEGRGEGAIDQSEQALPDGHLELLILPEDADLAVGDRVELSLVWRDGEDFYENPGLGLDWVSEDPGVATVSHGGLVQALAAGTVMIRVEIEGRVTEVMVTVKES